MISNTDWQKNLQKVFSKDPMVMDLSVKFSLSSRSKKNEDREACIIEGVPASFRKTFVSFLENITQKSFLYWDDSESNIESIENIIEWLIGEKKTVVNISKEKMKFSSVIRLLRKYGKFFIRTKTINFPGEYSVKGGNIEIYGYGNSKIVLLEFFDQNLERIKEIDVVTRLPIKNVESFNLILPRLEYQQKGTSFANEKNSFKSIHISSSKYPFVKDKVLVFVDPGFKKEKLSNIHHREYSFEMNIPEILFTEDINNNLEFLLNKYEKVNIVSTQLSYLTKKIKPQYQTEVDIFYGSLSRGVAFEYSKTVFVTDHELFGVLHPEKQIESTDENLETFLEDIKIGDYVVHEDHGIGIFLDIVEKEVFNEHGVKEKKEFLLLGYAKNDTLYVPVEQKSRIIKFVGIDGNAPRLTNLDGKTWDKAKKKIQKRIDKIAEDLVNIYAKRNLLTGQKYTINKDLDDKLSDGFIFELTRDQIKALQEIKADMVQGKMMDRLLVGDVGFGKTEIAMRAAFVAVYNGNQVAILAPTTILVQQHYKVFKERLSSFGIKVAYMSRMNTPEENRRVLADINEGKVDIIIGTHKLLSNKVKFKKLSLLVVDEEQRFGVNQKEKIKSIKENIDVLMMSATPIPRTLQMSLSRIRDISVIETPPPGRIPVETSISRFSWPLIFKAVKKEIERDGQIFFVHNKIQTIDSILSKFDKSLPKARCIVIHSQMANEKLSKIMSDFASKKYNVLICTSIIENGLDMPNVNTIIIDGAENFGLAELYQLRGRVGRSNREAFCHLLYRKKSEEFKNIVENRQTEYSIEYQKSVTTLETDGEKYKKMPKKNEKAKKRLRAILGAKELGSGFEISIKDLEIRGAGNFLGKEQHGFVSKIGLGLYMRILSQAVSVLRSQEHYLSR